MIDLGTLIEAKAIVADKRYDIVDREEVSLVEIVLIKKYTSK